jgi:gliding motility associated protien GldN
VGWKDPFSRRTTLQEVYIQAGGDSITQADGSIEVKYDGTNIRKFEVQEQWFFDKQHSVMKVRIIALAPVNYVTYNKLTFEEYDPPREMIPFIVYFPECRRLFATHSIYNANNDAQSISFDDLFFQRRFASTIIAESNVYGNRPLTSFKLGQDVLLEAEKLKNNLFIMEHDLWEY